MRRLVVTGALLTARSARASAGTITGPPSSCWSSPASRRSTTAHARSCIPQRYSAGESFAECPHHVNLWQSWVAAAAIYYARGIAMLELVLADGTGPAYTDPTGEGPQRRLAPAAPGLTGRTTHIAQQ
jgi:hypothetical protein